MGQHEPGNKCVLDCAESRFELWQTAHPGGRLSTHVYKLEEANDRRQVCCLGLMLRCSVLAALTLVALETSCRTTCLKMFDA